MRLNESTMNDGWDGVMDKVIEVEGRDISKDLALVALQVVNGLEREDAQIRNDYKRPFGNSDYISDILIDILGIEPDEDGFSQELQSYADSLYDSCPEFILNSVANYWRDISSVPSYEFVHLYSPNYEKTAGRNKKGVMQGFFRQAEGSLPAEFCDDFGIRVDWDFTHWMPIPNPPNP